MKGNRDSTQNMGEHTAVKGRVVKNVGVEWRGEEWI
jgi:hypothetical protein